jgi:hypothetical protein
MTTNKSLNTPSNGQYVNTWDVPTNANFTILDYSLGGTSTITVSASGTIALTGPTINGSTGALTSIGQYANSNLVFSGTLTGNTTYQLPAGVGGSWSVFNNTSGSYTLTISNANGGTSVTIPQGYTTQIWCDGTNVRQMSSTGVLAIPSVRFLGATSSYMGFQGPATGNGTVWTLPSADGSPNQYLQTNGSGTLQWASVTAGVSSFQTSLSGLTPSTATGGAITLAGTLGVASGGTGATTLTGYLVGNGTSAFTASSTIPTSALTGTLGTANGGTGTTSTTGTGAVVFGTSPTITSATLTTPAIGSGGATIAGATSGTLTLKANASTTSYTWSFPSTGGFNTYLLQTDGAGNTSWVSPGSLGGGTVSSVGFSTGTIGLSVSSNTTNPITGGGTFTLAGTLVVPNGGTGAATLSGYMFGNGTSPVTASTTIPGTAISGNISGSAAGLTSTLAVGSGGSGATTLTGYLYGNGTSAFTASTTIPGTAISGNISGNAANITGTYGGTITSSQVTTGLGFTPYNNTNPSGFITSSGSITGSSASCTGNAATSSSCTGNAATSSSCTGNAATATTANALNTGNPYQVNILGVGTAASATPGEIRASNNITAFYSSDRLLKTNIVNIPNALDKLHQINGVTFDWTDQYIKDRGGEDGYFVRKHDVGVIAQEINEVLPEVVATRQDGTMAVKYDRLTALLIEAVKELADEVALLRAQLKAAS